MKFEDFAIVASGGGRIGAAAMRTRRPTLLRCAGCGGAYPLALDPLALAFGPDGATVLPGFVEVCPHCHHEHFPGDGLAVESPLPGEA